MALSNPIHIAFLLVLLLLVFGARRLPEIGRSLGSGMRGFKESLSGEGEQQALDAPHETPEQPAVDPPTVLAPVREPRTPAA